MFLLQKPKQTVRDEDQKPVEVTKKPEKGDDPKNFLDEIKEAAQNCQNHTDFVYEPTSGLYYDTKTGYYYNAVSYMIHIRFDNVESSH